MKGIGSLVDDLDTNVSSLICLSAYVCRCIRRVIHFHKSIIFVLLICVNISIIPAYNTHVLPLNQNVYGVCRCRVFIHLYGVCLSSCMVSIYV